MSDANQLRLALLQAQGLTPRLKMLMKRHAKKLDRPLHFLRIEIEDGINITIRKKSAVARATEHFVAIAEQRMRNGLSIERDFAYLFTDGRDWRHPE